MIAGWTQYILLFLLAALSFIKTIHLWVQSSIKQLQNKCISYSKWKNRTLLERDCKCELAQPYENDTPKHNINHECVKLAIDMVIPWPMTSPPPPPLHRVKTSLCKECASYSACSATLFLKPMTHCFQFPSQHLLRFTKFSMGKLFL